MGAASLSASSSRRDNNKAGEMLNPAYGKAEVFE